MLDLLVSKTTVKTQQHTRTNHTFIGSKDKETI